MERYGNASGDGGLFCLHAGGDAPAAQGWSAQPGTAARPKRSLLQGSSRAFSPLLPYRAAPAAAAPSASRSGAAGPGAGKAGEGEGWPRHRPRCRPPGAPLPSETQEAASGGSITPRSWSRTHSSVVADHTVTAFKMLTDPGNARAASTSQEADAEPSRCCKVAEQDSNAAGSQSHTYRALSALESPPGVQQKEKMQQKPPTAALEELRILGFQT